MPKQNSFLTQKKKIPALNPTGKRHCLALLNAGFTLLKKLQQKEENQDSHDTAPFWPRSPVKPCCPGIPGGPGGPCSHNSSPKENWERFNDQFVLD